MKILKSSLLVPMFTLKSYLLYKDEKLSVHLNFCYADNLPLSALIEVALAQNESYVFEDNRSRVYSYKSTETIMFIDSSVY